MRPVKLNGRIARLSIERRANYIASYLDCQALYLNHVIVGGAANHRLYRRRPWR